MEDFTILNSDLTTRIEGYVASSYGKSLGVRRSGGRQPLHDPEAENALVLFEPKELSEHEKLKVMTVMAVLYIV